MVEELKRFFTDKTSGMNLKHGFQYHAAGIIEADYTKNGEGNSSGKDYTVDFISPLGEVERQWRSVDEIIIYDTEEANYELLKHAIEMQEIKNDEALDKLPDNQPNYTRFAPRCINCTFYCIIHNPGSQTVDGYCNIDKQHPYPVDDDGLCDSHNMED